MFFFKNLSFKKGNKAKNNKKAVCKTCNAHQ